MAHIGHSLLRTRLITTTSAMPIFLISFTYGSAIIANIDPTLFSTVLVPKQQELVATPFRFSGDKERAKRFFEDGFKAAFARMKSVHHPDFPLAVFYAFKQAEEDTDVDDASQSSIASTGWETILEALHTAGFEIGGTWPIRSEKKGRMLAVGTNALASSIVLTCRPQREAGFTTRREFVNALKRELPQALRTLRHGNIAPVDLAQAAIGPVCPSSRAIQRSSKQTVPPCRCVPLWH